VFLRRPGTGHATPFGVSNLTFNKHKQQPGKPKEVTTMNTRKIILSAITGSLLFVGSAFAQTDGTDTGTVPPDTNTGPLPPEVRPGDQIRDRIRDRLHDLAQQFREQNAELIEARKALAEQLKNMTEEERKEAIAKFREEYKEQIKAAREQRRELRRKFLEKRREIRQRIRERMKDRLPSDGNGDDSAPGGEG